MPPAHIPPALDADHQPALERLAFDLGAFNRELRRHPLTEALGIPRHGRRRSAKAGRLAGLLPWMADALLASAAQLPVAVLRGDEGQVYALRHVMIQGAWFDAAKRHAGDVDALLAHGPEKRNPSVHGR